MCDRILTKWMVGFAAVLTLTISLLGAQELPKSEDSFEVEPPLLIPPGDVGRGANNARETQPDVTKLAEQLQRAKKSAASAERLVKTGVLAKIEAEERALRAVRLESELANAQLAAAKEQVALQKARSEASQASTADLDATTVTLARASAAAKTADANYHKAQLDAAALNLRRQRQLLARGSARKSDVSHAEEKLAALQRGDQTPR
jgi:hypothetical protein